LNTSGSTTAAQPGLLAGPGVGGSASKSFWPSYIDQGEEIEQGCQTVPGTTSCSDLSQGSEVAIKCIDGIGSAMGTEVK